VENKERTGWDAKNNLFIENCSNNILDIFSRLFILFSKGSEINIG
jgi:hypothetical protein